jgi:hypothetical protein
LASSQDCYQRLDLFKQEYPATADEAFLSTGRPIFNNDYVHARLKVSEAPITLMASSSLRRQDGKRELPLAYSARTPW